MKILIGGYFYKRYDLEDTTQKVYKILADSDGLVSGGEIGRKLGISRNAVNKHVNKLRADGIEIASESKGYRLIVGETFSAVTLAEKLGGHVKVILKECDSTNNYAREAAGRIDGNFLVVAPKQSGGRGRLDRVFISREGGAYMTLAYKSNGITPVNSLNLVLLSGIAVSRTLEKFGIESRIKWPNDVMAGGKKICGILLESVLNAEYLDRIYIGIGINMYNDIEDISDIATNFDKLGIKGVGREEMISELTQNLLTMLDDFSVNGFDDYRDEYVAKSASIGRDVSVKVGGCVVSGKAVGISDNGYLLIEKDGKIKEIVAGDLTFNL